MLIPEPIGRPVGLDLMVFSACSTLLLPPDPAVILHVHDRSHPHPLRHRAGRPARRGATVAVGLQRTASVGGPTDDPGKPRAHASGNSAGPRSLPAAPGPRS